MSEKSGDLAFMAVGLSVSALMLLALRPTTTPDNAAEKTEKVDLVMRLGGIAALGTLAATETSSTKLKTIGASALLFAPEILRGLFAPPLPAKLF